MNATVSENSLISEHEHQQRPSEGDPIISLPDSQTSTQHPTTSGQWMEMTVLSVALAPGRLREVKEVDGHAVMLARPRSQPPNATLTTSPQ
jgi:hypothetical protein